MRYQKYLDYLNENKGHCFFSLKRSVYKYICISYFITKDSENIKFVTLKMTRMENVHSSLNDPYFPPTTGHECQSSVSPRLFVYSLKVS